MKTLPLTLKKDYFDQIASGAKKQEFRKVKKHWIERLCGIGSLINTDFSDVETFVPKTFDKVVFKNGYKKDAPTLEIEFLSMEIQRDIQTPIGKGDFFVINLGAIISRS